MRVILKQMECDRRWAAVTVLEQYMFKQTFKFLKYRFISKSECGVDVINRDS